MGTSKRDNDAKNKNKKAHMYLYFKPINETWLKTDYIKKEYGSASAYVDALVHKDRVTHLRMVQKLMGEHEAP